MKKTKRTKQAAKFIGLAVLIAIVLHFFIDIVRYPEIYSPSLKYQLQQDLQQGDPEAIEYYNNTYVKSGKKLFD